MQLDFLCNVEKNAAFLEYYSHLWWRFTRPDRSALTVITALSLSYVLHDRITPTSVSAVWLRYLISLDLLTDPEDIGVVKSNAKTGLSYIIHLNNLKKIRGSATKRASSHFTNILNILRSQFAEVPKMNYIVDYHVIMDLSKDW